MRIHFDDGSSVGITLTDSVLKDTIIYCYKHLQHVDIPHQVWHWSVNLELEILISNLIKSAKKFNIKIDNQKCLKNDQQYFNYLHSIFEKNYDGNLEWADFHETIHLLEHYFDRVLISNDSEIFTNSLHIRYREMAGLVQKPFENQWRSDFVTKVKTGQVFCTIQELGKTPLRYWLDKEPDNIDRLCELAKPWVKLKPVLTIALLDIDFMPTDTERITEFQSWWKSYEKPWCDHWNIDSWSLEDMCSVIPVGWIDDIDTLISARQKKSIPRRVSLNNSLENFESLCFEIEIEAIWNSHAPSLKILINENLIKILDLHRGINQIKFDVVLNQGEHFLEIQRFGATSLDNSQILKINRICIDKIDCSQLILKNSFFYPEYPEPWATQQKEQNQELLSEIPFETVLGHNGSWKINFSSPIYPQLLEINSKPLCI